MNVQGGLRLLANAPHRLMFAIGAANVLLAMLWWAAWLVATRWQVASMPQPDVYAGWVHAIVMQYQVLAPFMFGFLINPPLSLYFMQGLNLTPLHGHTALFGVYGMLGIALVLFCMRGLRGQMVWNTAALKLSFWTLNIGLALMALLTLLPLGTMQLLAAIEHGYWYARSAEFMNQPIVDLLVWMRVPGDTIFSVGAVALAWFVLRLWIAPRRDTDVVGAAEAATSHKED